VSATKRPARIVAELGRPETPEETAARISDNSRKYRSRKTLNNLVLSLLVTVGAVVVLVLLVPRTDTVIDRNVDYSEVVAQLQIGIDEPLVDPDLPEGWRANAAEWRPGTNDDVPSWYLGLLTPKNQFIGLSQAIDANATWLAARLSNTPASDVITIDGVEWDVYLNPAPENERGNFEYALVTTAASSTYLMVGTADAAEFSVLAEALGDSIRANSDGAAR
jgi:hypothetical protein